MLLLLLLWPLLLLLFSSSSVSEIIVEKFKSQGLHDKFHLVDQKNEGRICCSYDIYMAERKNIYRIIVDKH